MKIYIKRVGDQDETIKTLRDALSTLPALQSELATLQTSKATLTTSLQTANTTISSLRSSLENAQSDVAYMRDQYQNASTAATARAKECFLAEEESKRLSALIDTGLKQYDLIHEAQITKLSREIERTKGELELAKGMNEGTKGIRRMASLWEEHLATELAEEEEREAREERMIAKRQAAMLAGPSTGSLLNKFDSDDSDEDDEDDDSDEDGMELDKDELAALRIKLEEGVEEGAEEAVDETQEDPEDPNIFVCRWRPACGEALSSRNVRPTVLEHSTTQTDSLK